MAIQPIVIDTKITVLLKISGRLTTCSATCNCVTQVRRLPIDAHWSWLHIAIEFLVIHQV